MALHQVLPAWTGTSPPGPAREGPAGDGLRPGPGCPDPHVLPRNGQLQPPPDGLSAAPHMIDKEDLAWQDTRNPPTQNTARGRL